MARREVDIDVREYFNSRRRRTAYIYNVGPDTLQLTKGELGAYLRQLGQ